MEILQNRQIITDTLANLEIPLSRLRELGGVFSKSYSRRGEAVSLLKEVGELEKQKPENKKQSTQSGLKLQK